MDAEYSYLNAAVEDAVKTITSVGGAVDSAMMPVFFMTGVLIFLFACLKFLWQRDLTPLAEFFLHYIKLMALIFVSGHWMDVTDTYVNQMGQFGARLTGFDILTMAPGPVIIKGLDLAGKMYSENVSWMRIAFGSTEDSVAHLLLLIGCLGTILLSVLIAAMLMLFFVVFKLASVVALVFLVFMAFGPTRFMAAPGISRILAYGVQMLVLTFICGLYFELIGKLDLSGHLRVDQSLTVLVVMFFGALLFKHATAIAREQISGMPSLDLHDIGRMAGSLASMIPAVGMPALGAFAGARIAGNASARYGLSFGGSSPGPQTAITSAPQAAMRMLNKPPIDATWTDAKDLGPAAARRMLNRSPTDTTWTDGKDLPPSSTRQLPPPPRQLPPPRS